MLAGDPSFPVGQPTLMINSATNQITNPGYTYDNADLLQSDSVKFENIVRDNVHVALYPEQFDMLADFTFNTGALPGTKLHRALNAGNYDQVPDLMSEWVHSGGQVLDALVTRRANEGYTFATGDYVGCYDK